MRYTIEWDPNALRELALIWDDSLSKRRIAIDKALGDIDRLLRADASSVGESRSTPALRWVCVFPVILTVFINDRIQVARIIEARVYD
ncbi:hypothetical protein MalM25_32750 [Planctomycetes bacterium MalM25]|nr:hypothetical protein MalM25_32750 [Planctomycetes bacterium MalM25]